MKSHDDVLQQLKSHEARIKEYQQKDTKPDKIEEAYKLAAYKIKNPFRGI